MIHRDIKPQIIRLGKYGETIVLDWGLAKHVAHSEQARQSGESTLAPSTTDSSNSQFGQAYVTRVYMSPNKRPESMWSRRSVTFAWFALETIDARMAQDRKLKSAPGQIDLVDLALPCTKFIAR